MCDGGNRSVFLIGVRSGSLECEKAMMKRVLVLFVVLGLSLGFFVSVKVGSAVTYTVGVEAGQWATYSVLGGWDVQPANASVSMPQAIRDARNTDFINMSVESASLKTATLARTTHFRNGTRTVALISGNVETGAGTLNLTVVSRDLEAGDKVTTASSAFRIVRSEQKTYASAERAVNYANSTEYTSVGTSQYEFRWDMATGIMVGMFFVQEDRSSEFAAISSIVITIQKTNIWNPEGSNPLSFFTRFGSEILVVGVFVTAAVLTGYAVFRKPKRGRGRRR